MNQIDIEGIRARADKAAPGPWEVVYHNEDYGQGYGETTFFVKINDCLMKIGVASNPKSYEVYDTLAKGIVLDHKDIPALLDAYTEQAAEIARLEGLVARAVADIEYITDAYVCHLTCGKRTEGCQDERINGRVCEGWSWRGFSEKGV